MPYIFVSETIELFDFLNVIPDSYLPKLPILSKTLPLECNSNVGVCWFNNSDPPIAPDPLLGLELPYCTASSSSR